jgi:hypothetical protein
MHPNGVISPLSAFASPSSSAGNHLLQIKVWDAKNIGAATVMSKVPKRIQ